MIPKAFSLIFLQDDRIFGAFHIVLQSLTSFKAAAMIFLVFELFLDFPEALFVDDSTDFLFFSSDHEKLSASTRFHCQVRHAFVFAVDLRVDFEVFQLLLMWQETMAAATDFEVRISAIEALGSYSSGLKFFSESSICTIFGLIKYSTVLFGIVKKFKDLSDGISNGSWMIMWWPSLSSLGRMSLRTAVYLSSAIFV
jgi:hypothetical protein